MWLSAQVLVVVVVEFVLITFYMTLSGLYNTFFRICGGKFLVISFKLCACTFLFLV